MDRSLPNAKIVSAFITDKISHKIRPQREGTSTMVEEEVTNVFRGKKGGNIRSFDVPTDVYGLEILANLPTKNLQTLKIVCKDWLQLISSSYFIRLHLARGIRSRIRVLVSGFQLPAIVEYNNYYIETKQQISYPPQFYRGTRIVGSADGLIFLLSGKFTAVFNPSTRKCSSVQLLPPAPNGHFPIYYWFGNLGVGEYVLFMGLLSEGPHYEIWVYKFTQSSNVVNRIRNTQLNNMQGFDVLEKKGTFVQGAVHWPIRLFCEPSYRILTYYLDENKHAEISPPAQCDFRLGLFVDGCSLFATFKRDMSSVVEIWIMKENCWTKYANIEGSKNLRVLYPLGFFLNGDVIMDANNSLLMKYSFNHKEVTVLMEYGVGMDDVVLCADGLVSPSC